MSFELGYQQVLALVLEQLKQEPRSQYEDLAQAVIRAAARKGLADLPSDLRGFGLGGPALRIYEYVRQALWECVTKGLVVPGMDHSNQNWPWYSVTERGQKMIDAGSPQPYDRDGFVAYMKKHVPYLDQVVHDYFVEAVDCFNGGCHRASAVMLGVASEQLILLLGDAFAAALSDGGKKTKLEKELDRAWQASTRYRAIKERLDLMSDAKKLPQEHAETVGSELGGVFELIRRYRNASGHPNVPGHVDADTVFLNLRTFIEYARRVSELIDFFKTNAADW